MVGHIPSKCRRVAVVIVHTVITVIKTKVKALWSRVSWLTAVAVVITVATVTIN